MTKAPDGYENVLTRKEWKGVIDFCQYLDAKLVTSFAISDGMRDQKDGGMLLSVEGIAVDKKSWPTMMISKMLSMVEEKALDEMEQFEDAWVENMNQEC